MIREKKAKILGLRELFLSCFWHFPNQKKNYQRNSSTLKGALVNNNKESIIKSRIMQLI